MSMQFEESNFDFDLEYLNPSSSNPVVTETSDKSEKSRKAILIVKKKIVATDSLIRRYYEKRDEVDQFERALQISKDECKQTCMDFRNISEKYKILHEEVQTLRSRNVELEGKFYRSESLSEAMKSHANQLQVLVSKHETTIESLNSDIQQQKANTRASEKNVLLLQEEKADLIKDICLMRDIISGKRKKNKNSKLILQKYKKYFASDDDNDSLLSDNSDTDIENHCPQLTKETHKLEIVNSTNNNAQAVTVKDDNEPDSDYSNEVASADTGRGSSIASSDVEKCFNSPDYYPSHSPINTHKDQEKTIYVDTATSPIQFNENCHTTECPSPFETIQITLSPILDEVEDNSPVESELKFFVTNSENGHLAPNEDVINDGSIVPIVSNNTNDSNITENVMVDISIERSSPLDFCDLPEDNSPDVKSNSLDRADNINATSTSRVTCPNNKKCNEKECLELNNSNNFNETNTGDCEIEMILDKMRFNRTLITPIPFTPSKSRNASVIRDMSSKLSYQEEHVCKDAAKLKEENKILYEKYNKLEQDIVLIKDILKNNFTFTVPVPPAPVNPEVIVSTPVKNNTNTVLLSAEKNVTINIDSPQPLLEQNIPVTEETIEYSAGTEKMEVKTHVTPIINKASAERPSPKTPQIEKESNSDGSLIETVNSMDMSCMKNIPEERDQIASKHRKLSKLEKLRKKLVPKSKIKRNKTPTISKLRNKRKQILTKKNVVESDTTATLGKINVYKKAVQIMSELKSQQKSAKERDCNLNVNSKTTKNPVKHNTTKSKEIQHRVVLESDSAATLNNKSVYENAVKIMLELKSQQKSAKQREHNTNDSSKSNTSIVDHNTSENVDSKNRIPIEKDNSAILNNNNANEKPVQIKSELKNQHKSAVTKEENHDENSNKNPVEPNISKIMELKHRSDESNSAKNKVINKKELVSVKYDQDLNYQIPTSPTQVSTRSRSKQIEEITSRKTNLFESENKGQIDNTAKNIKSETQLGTRKRQKSQSVETQHVPCKRILRSSNVKEEVSLKIPNNSPSEIPKPKDSKNANVASIVSPPCKNIVNYDDLNLFNDDEVKSTDKVEKSTNIKGRTVNSKDIIFCLMLDKYGRQKRKKYQKKATDSVLNSTATKLQEKIVAITGLNGDDAKRAMCELVNTIKNWDPKLFIAAFMIYLQDAQRKIELFNKITSPPAPPMTKSEQIILYVISQLRGCWPNIDVLNCVLCNIEYVLFKLNKTPDFDTIESMAHFYAVLCRYFKMKSRLRLFMLDAMYCIQFKAVPLIKQCLDVWMHVLPLAHMGIAKSPLVTCLVYLLHFYKCEDRFNRVQEIRNILSRKYSYEITEWNEPKIIEMFRNAIRDVKAVPVETKLLRLALIVIAKRHGPSWCQKNIVKNILLPMIEKDLPERVKIFCISVLGPLLKPYPTDMKVHCEIVINMLHDKLQQNTSTQFQEAIIGSLIYMSKHAHHRVLQTLLTWKPQQISPEMELLLRDFVLEKPMKVWRDILSKMYF